MKMGERLFSIEVCNIFFVNIASPFKGRRNTDAFEQVMALMLSEIKFDYMDRISR